MAGGIDWFRWHHGSVTDPKFQLVARKSGASLPDVLAVWAYLLEAASMASERGRFGEIDAEALDCMFGFPATETRTADVMKSMQERGLIDGDRIAAWEKRQPKREREDDNSTERSRQSRQRQKEQQESMQRHATPCNANESQETPREEEIREEKEEKQRKSKAETQRATRLPADWRLTDEDFEFCKTQRPDLNIGETAARFRDYWLGIGGQKGCKLDWSATWRNWVRNEKQSQQPRASPARPVLDLAAAQKAANEEAKRRLFGRDDGRTIDA